MDGTNGTYTLSAYLIAQLGKNFANGANGRITGEQLLQSVLDTIKEMQNMAGGMVIFLESDNDEKLIDFYEEKNRFKRFVIKDIKAVIGDSHTLIEFIKVL